MEDQHMHGEPSIFVWGVRCKSSRTFALRLRDFWWEDFSSFLQPSIQISISLAFEFLHLLSSGDCLCVKKGLRLPLLLLWDRVCAFASSNRSRENCSKGSRPLSKRRKIMKQVQNKARPIK
ncbi:uncharacterized protein LOC109947937 isoform X2 [Prunus persica]|uniref:uncharacterized protein LOC109947937 isoform X2 n=1 Tax=Prunus persica TaxID=3760 RepID=UPI0009AB6F56|nr:uncharacterized protein LOC109947937 isoform X2 [Prunus persica]